MRAGLLPVKSLSAAKSRLGLGLRPQDRQAVVRALCEDALDLVAEDREFHWWIVTHDPEVKEMARARGLATIVDGGGGLNRVLLHASEKVRGLGFTSVFMMPSDLPLATTTDLRQVSRAGETSDVVVVAAESGGGTNGLLMSPPGIVRPCFGPGSLRAHVAAATGQQLSCSVLLLPRLSLDLDTTVEARELLERFEVSTPCGRTHSVLAHLRDSGDLSLTQ